MSSSRFHSIPEMDQLLEKFTELLTGEATEERMEMVLIWSLYSHMLKAMPQLVQHWGSEPEHQEARAQIRFTIEQIKKWNQEKQSSTSPPTIQ